MNIRNLLLALATMTGFTAITAAQQSATIEGRVKDASNRDFLPGAAIYLDGTGYATISDNEGIYALHGVPAGTYELKVSYIGYEEYTNSITLDRGEVLVHDIDLQASFIELHEVEVVGLRQGQIKALNQHFSSVA